MLSPLPPTPGLHAQWSAHKGACRKPNPLSSIALPPPDDGPGSTFSTRLPRGVQHSAAAEPTELTTLVRAFMTAAGDVPPASIAAQRLYDIARASVADALTVVSTEGLLPLLDRNLGQAVSATGGGADGRDLASAALMVLIPVLFSGNAVVCGRVAQGGGGLLLSLVRLVARGPRGRGFAPSPGDPPELKLGLDAALALACIAKSSVASAAACGRAVDDLSDAELKALVDASVGLPYMLLMIRFLDNCLCHAPLLPRLVGPAGLPLALAKLLAGEGTVDESLRILTGLCIQRLLETAREHGPPLAAWAKPLVKPLRYAFL